MRKSYVQLRPLIYMIRIGKLIKNIIKSIL